jgi:hypothetical protein
MQVVELLWKMLTQRAKLGVFILHTHKKKKRKEKEIKTNKTLLHCFLLFPKFLFLD